MRGWGLSLLFFALALPAAARDEQIPLKLDDGRVVQATLRLPARTNRPLPALMLFGGFQHAAEVLEKVRTDRPVIWATFDYPFEPPRKFRFPESLKYFPEAKAAIHGTFDGVVKLHQALLARKDVDPRRITVVGASAGSPFAVVGAARTEIPGVILVQGFSDVTRVWQNLLTRKYRARFGDWIQWPALWLAQFVHWYCGIPDIAAHARQLRPSQKVLLFTSLEDTFIPKEASDELWTALQNSPSVHERIELKSGHLGVGDDTQLIADILQRAMKWAEKQGLL